MVISHNVIMVVGGGAVMGVLPTRKAREAGYHPEKDYTAGMNAEMKASMAELMGKMMGGMFGNMPDST